MCGLSGILSRAPLNPAQRSAAGAMNDAMLHRGPDGEGRFDDIHVALAMRRLSIIDIAGSAQPLMSADGRLALVFNGEIYNYPELRAELSAQGHVFRTQGDGEVILGLYARHGLDFVDRLRGMFVIALWDATAQRLVLARDRMGEKPLYLREAPGTLVFASEMKALLRADGAGFTLDPAAVHLYFHYQYVPEPLTPVRGIRKLDAGHMLVAEVQPWRTREFAYWRMADSPPLEGDAPALIRERLEEAARLSLRADVPVGVALSGGVDSSLVAALASKEADGAFAAFSVGYPGRPAHDERSAAGALARTLGLPFHEVELDPEEMAAVFPAMNAWRDDPIADIAGFGYYAVMRAAARFGIKVMLQGQGGDELFWGYGELRAARTAAHRANRRRRWPWPFGPSGGPPALPFYEKAPDFRDAARNMRACYAPAFVEAVATVNPAALPGYRDTDEIDIALTERICATYLRENGIAQGERLGMTSSVELRLPLMDHRLVETVIGLRKHSTDAGLPAKAWLKAAIADLLPAEILDRPKRGFEPPVRAWHDLLFARYGEFLVEGELVERKILSPEGSLALAKGTFPAGAIAPLSFKALVLEMWCRGMSGR